MARNWVELHATIDSNIFDGTSEFEMPDGITPEYDSTRISALDVTGRLDGPFAGRQYLRGSDTWQDKPADPAPPPPTSEEQRRLDLIADDSTARAAEDTLLAKDHTTWTQADRDEAQQMILRKSEIVKLRVV